MKLLLPILLLCITSCHHSTNLQSYTPEGPETYRFNSTRRMVEQFESSISEKTTARLKTLQSIGYTGGLLGASKSSFNAFNHEERKILTRAHAQGVEDATFTQNHEG